MPPSEARPSAVVRRVLLVLGQTPYPVELVDEGFRVVYCNAAYAWTFLTPGLPVLDRPSSVFPLDVDGHPREYLLLQVKSKGLWKGELVTTTASGQVLPVRVRLFPVHDPEGGQEVFAVYYEDISSEVVERAALDHERHLLAVRNRQAQMGELLNMIAHQWRQPLTVVMSLIGNIQLKTRLQGTVEPEYLQNKLDKMTQNLQFLSDTIDAFRSFHEPSRNKTLEDLAHLVTKAVALVSPSLEKMGILIEVLPDPEPLKVRVIGPEVQQLVLELINNARDALSQAAPFPATVRLRTGQRDGWAQLAVENNGVSLDPEVIPHIFDPYFTTKGAIGGSGLGLYMAKTIVETHHGGRLSVTAHDGWTSFVCEFPLEEGS